MAGSSRRWRPAGYGPPPCRSFYADTAAQLGWKSAGEGRFTRDGESLRIELIDPGAPGGALTVRFLVNPQ